MSSAKKCTLKSILFLFVVVILTFGITGAVLYSMGDGDNRGESSATVIVEDTPEIVFEWVSLPSFSTRWVHGLKRAKKVTKGDLKVGSIVRETIKTPNGGVAEITGKILKFEKNKTIETEYYVSGTKLKRGEMVPLKRGDYATKSFVSTIVVEKIEEKKTKVTYTIKAEYGRWYTRFLEPLMTSDTVDDMETSLKSLKEKIKKSGESQRKKKREKEERLKKRELKKRQKKMERNQLKQKKKLDRTAEPFDSTGVIKMPKLKPMLKLNPKMDRK